VAALTGLQKPTQGNFSWLQLIAGFGYCSTQSRMNQYGEILSHKTFLNVIAHITLH
jgi:hypothetical protein